MSNVGRKLNHTRQPKTTTSPGKDWSFLYSFGSGVSNLVNGNDFLSPLPAGGVVPGYDGMSGLLFETGEASTTSGKLVPGLTNQITVVMVIDFLATTGANTFTFGESAAAQGPYNYGFYETLGGLMRFFIHNGTSGAYANSTVLASSLRGVQIWTATYDGATISLYQNGTKISTASQTGNIQRNTSATLSFQRWKTNGTNSRVYALAVSTRAMSSNEIFAKFSKLTTTWGALFPPTEKTRHAGTVSGNITQNRTITGISRIQKSVNSTVVGIARIQKVVNQTETGISRIQKIVNSTITGVSRIQKIVNATETGIARIQKSVNQTITGVSRIQKSVNQTKLGVSRIQKVVNQTITGVANILSSNITQNKTITGVARIQATIARTESGVSRIQKSVDQAITGISRISLVTTKTETGVSRVQKVVSAAENGVARITKTSNRTITGISRITTSGVTPSIAVTQSVEIGGGIIQSQSTTGNVIEVDVMTSLPSGAPANNKGVVFVLIGGVATIYVWSGSAWISV